MSSPVFFKAVQILLPDVVFFWDVLFKDAFKLGDFRISSRPVERNVSFLESYYEKSWTILGETKMFCV